MSRARLIERLYRVPGIGPGLGLYICQSLVERPGRRGERAGRGSTFWFAVALLNENEAGDMERSAPG